MWGSGWAQCCWAPSSRRPATAPCTRGWRSWWSWPASSTTQCTAGIRRPDAGRWPEHDDEIPVATATGGPDELELDLNPEIPLVSADPGLLQRVVVNLLANATRHSPDDSKVRITTSSLDDIVEIRVIDHGPGIPPDRIDDVFVPFQRLGDTDNTSGLGLGLALSKGFVEGMGGTLTPEDTPGGGLTMVVALPTHNSTTAQPEDTPS